MLSLATKSFFKALADEISEYGINFSSYYTFNIDDLKQYMSSFQLRQQFDPTKLKNAILSSDLENSLFDPRPGGGSFNAMQYKYSPMKPSTSLNNSFPIWVVIDKKKKTINQQADNPKTPPAPVYFLEDDIELEAQKGLKYEEDNPLGKMDKNIHMTMSGEYLRKDAEGNYIPNDNQEIEPEQEIRRGFFAEFDLECRFLTTNTSIFEDFLFLYNTLYYKKNPKFEIPLKDLSVGIWARTNFSEISMAEQLDYATKGNLLAIGFTVKIDTFMISSFVKKEKPIRSIEVHFEARNNSAPKL